MPTIFHFFVCLKIKVWQNIYSMFFCSTGGITNKDVRNVCVCVCLYLYYMVSIYNDKCACCKIPIPRNPVKHTV
jgi:hypothetical protein